jgi:hypothetical protein
VLSVEWLGRTVDMAVLRVRKCHVTGGTWVMAVLRVRKYVMLLGKSGIW